MEATAGYDSLNQLAAFSWGTWSDANSDGTPDTISSPSRSQSWTPDGQGNFTTVTTKGTVCVLRRSGVPPLGLIGPGLEYWPNRTVFPGSREVTREPIVKTKRRDAASTEDPTATISRPSRSQSWTPDGQGNFTTVTTNGTGETRTYDKQNELTAVGSTSLTYDAAGNLKTDEQNRTFVYDAWNGLISVSVPNNPNSFQAVYTIDPLGRRITETSGGVTRDLYYSADWQVIEERVGGVAKAQFVWSPVYVDALIERDRDADGNTANGLEERLYVQHDANFNVTALIDTSGNVVERYVYDPYGKVTILSPDGSTVRTSSSYGWSYLHQGGRQDTATGLLNFRNRDYSTSLMRWTTNDPIGFAGGDTNTYRYVGNGPGNGLDPSGLQETDPVVGYRVSTELKEERKIPVRRSDIESGRVSTKSPNYYPIKTLRESEFTEESALKILREKIKLWESQGHDAAAELLKEFIKPNRAKDATFDFEKLSDKAKSQIYKSVQRFSIHWSIITRYTSNDQIENIKIIAGENTNIRWFSDNPIIGYGQAFYILAISPLKGDFRGWRFEIFAGTDENMFNALGGARLTFSGFHWEGGRDSFIRFDVLLEDLYQFPDDIGREFFEAYRAAMFLSGIKDERGEKKYPPFNVSFKFTMAIYPNPPREKQGR